MVSVQEQTSSSTGSSSAGCWGPQLSPACCCGSGSERDAWKVAWIQTEALHGCWGREVTSRYQGQWSWATLCGEAKVAGMLLGATGVDYTEPGLSPPFIAPTRASTCWDSYTILRLTSAYGLWAH